MKITVKGQEGQFTLITIVSETVVVDTTLGIKSTEIRAFAYCFNKERKAFRFPAQDIERYD